MHRMLLFAIFLPALLIGANRDMVQLQRDVAQVQDQVRTLQRSLDDKVAALQVLAQQTLDTVNKQGTSVAVMESGLRDRFAEQSKSIAGPVVNASGKIDQMASEFSALKESVGDLAGTMAKLQQQIVDLGNMIKVMQAPPAPPPSVGGASAVSATPPAGMSSRQLYDNAMRDRSGGNLDLALQGYGDYLKYYGTTDLAPNAQFYIGQVYYDRNEFPNALQAFDLVLEKYPENNKTADAMYMKGMTLLKSGQRTEAGKEFLNVIQRHPSSEVAPKAVAQRRALGLSVPTAAAPARRAPRR